MQSSEWWGRWRGAHSVYLTMEYLFWVLFMAESVVGLKGQKSPKLVCSVEREWDKFEVWILVCGVFKCLLSVNRDHEPPRPHLHGETRIGRSQL